MRAHSSVTVCSSMDIGVGISICSNRCFRSNPMIFSGTAGLTPQRKARSMQSGAQYTSSQDCTRASAGQRNCRWKAKLGGHMQRIQPSLPIQQTRARDAESGMYLHNSLTIELIAKSENIRKQIRQSPAFVRRTLPFSLPCRSLSAVAPFHLRYPLKGGGVL